MRAIIAAAAVLAGTALPSQAAVYTSPYYGASYLGSSIPQFLPDPFEVVTKVIVDVSWLTTTDYRVETFDYTGLADIQVSGAFTGILQFFSSEAYSDKWGSTFVIGPYTAQIQVPDTRYFSAWGAGSEQLTLTSSDFAPLIGAGTLTIAAQSSGFAGASSTTPNVMLQLDDIRPTSGSASFRFSYYTSSIPEPATWLMMIAGFGLVGRALRRKAMLPAG